MKMNVAAPALAFVGALQLTACGSGTPPANSAKVTWVAVADWYFDVGNTRVYLDGALTRFDPTNFYGGGSGLSYSNTAVCNSPTTDQKVLTAIGKKPSYILTGHSNLDHSYDTAQIAKLTGAHIIGSPSTCLEAQGQGVAASQCTVVMGGESI